MLSIRGSSSAWRATLQCLQRDFRQAGKKHPRLRHVVVQALDEEHPVPASLEKEMRDAGGWSVGEMRGRWEVPAGNETCASHTDWLRWNSPAKCGYLFGDQTGRRRFEYLAERSWLALPGTRDGKNQAYPQPRPLERWMAFVYRELDGAASPYLTYEDVLWVVDLADGQCIERRYELCTVTQGNIVSTGYPDADGLSNRARRWVYTALATDPFTASAVAIDLLLAHPDPEGPHLVSWQEMDAHQRSPAFQNANFLIDFIILANGKRFPVYRRDCMAVLGATPSICPSAEPEPPVRLRPNGELMADMERRFRQLQLIGDGETIHWVGRQATVETSCVCHLSNPLPGAVTLPARQSECKTMTSTNYDRLHARLLDILTGDVLPLPRWDDDKRHEQQIAIAVCEATDMTPEHWDKLDRPSREPWLEKTIHMLAKQQMPADSKDGRRVVLRAPGERPEVDGVDKEPLTLPQYDVVKALLEAGERGLSKDELDRKSNHGDARKILRRLAKSDPGWNAVIRFAGKSGVGYRIG